MEEEDIDQDKFMSFDQQNTYDMVQLNYIKEFYLSRIYLKKTDDFEPLAHENLFLYIKLSDKVFKIDLLKYV